MRLLSVRKTAIYIACFGMLGWNLLTTVSYRLDEFRKQMSGPELLPKSASAKRLPSLTGHHYVNGIDQGVRFASALANLVPQNFSITDVVQKDAQVDFNWPISERDTTVRLRNLSKYQIKGQGSGAVKLFVNGEPQAAIAGDDADASDGSWSFNVAATGRIEVQHADTSLSITVESPSALPIEPRIQNVSNRAHLPPTANDLTGTILVYDRFLHVSGNNVRPGTELEFRVFKDSGNAGNGPWNLLNTFAFPSPPVAPEDNGRWEARLEIPGEQDFLDGNFGLIEVLASESGKYNVSTKTVKFKVSTPPSALQPPAFDSPAVTVAEVGQGNVTNANSEYFSNRQRVKISGTFATIAGVDGTSNGQIVLLSGAQREVLSTVTTTNEKWQAIVSLEIEGKHEIRAAWEFGDKILKESPAIALNVRTSGPIVDSVQPVNFASTPNDYQITVTFDEKLADSVVNDVNMVKSKFLLIHANGEGVRIDDSNSNNRPKLSEDKKSVILVFEKFTPDNFTFKIIKDGVKDLYGNTMKEDYTTTLFKPIGGEIAEPSRGISGATGPYVPYGEYTKPRPFINGFNPSDHVETRVSRLYYFRDAHRVAQIINRDSRSHNRAAVDMQQQLADKARTIADQATDERRDKEREAVSAAEKTREAERELQQAEANAQRAAAEAANANAQVQQLNGVLNDPARTLSEADKSQLNRDIGQVTDARNSLEQIYDIERRRAAAAADKVQAFRVKEADANERWQGSIAVEDRAREEQFRREVAAAHADPDTYAGKTRLRRPCTASISICNRRRTNSTPRSHQRDQYDSHDD